MKKKQQSREVALLSLIKKDKREAFEVIYDTFSSDVFSYIFTKIGDKEVSKDILQDTFIGFWDKMEKVETSIIGYLKTSAKFYILKYFRSKKVEHKYTEYLQFFLNDFYRADYGINEEDLYRRILHILDKLPKKCKDSFLLSRFDGMSNEEIAVKLGVSKGTVENYISLAIKEIRIALLKD